MLKRNNQLLAILLSVLLVPLSGCSDGLKANTHVSEMQIKCIDGVKYFLFREVTGNAGYGYMSVKYTKNGGIETCQKAN